MSRPSRVIGAAHVERAGRLGKRVMEVLPGRIVTVQARESAARLRITLRDGPLERPTVPMPDGATTLRRVLYRRSPRWVAPKPTAGRAVTRFERLAIIGTGGVGGSLAHLAANANLAGMISLVDLVPGRAEAIALDLNHAAGLTHTECHVAGSTELTAVAESDVVVITAGRARAPGMSRADLTAANRRVVHAVAEAIRTSSPQAVVIVVTNPVEDLTWTVMQATEFPRERVLGMAGTLDSARFRQSLARAAEVPPADVEAMVLGCHGDEMVPIVSRATIQGRPIHQVLSAEQIAQCKRETIAAGGQVVALRRTGSAHLAPAHAVLEILEHMRGARTGPLPVTVQLANEYQLGDAILGVPVQLGRSGLIEVVELPLTGSEHDELRAAAAAVTARLGSGAGA